MWMRAAGCSSVRRTHALGVLQFSNETRRMRLLLTTKNSILVVAASKLWRTSTPWTIKRESESFDGGPLLPVL